MSFANTLIETVKLNGVDPQAWLTDVLCRIADRKTNKIDELLPGKDRDPASQTELRTRTKQSEKAHVIGMPRDRCRITG